LSATDPRAVTIKEVFDSVWLRVLDLPGAVTHRAFDSDGEVTLRVIDDMGYCDGTWLLRVRDGAGSAERVSDEAAIEVRVEDLAQVWLGHRSVTDLARSGALTGTGDGINVLHRLLAWTTPAYNVATF
ncbi:MAG TPA: sterol carrier protein domain-containing protein, partial [Tessaracoccus flavescens]|nr:sterol carrier protein domain-containing protein [Tessaracoccus flavescens]